MIEESTAPERIPYGLHLGLRAVKQGVRLEDYAASLTELRTQGLRMAGRCPLPDHEDRVPSFMIYPESQSWYCFGCSRGGDVLDLCQAVEDHTELWTAMVALSERYGVELPQRPPSWFLRQREKDRVRESARRHVATVYQRRLTRLYAPIVLVGGETPEEELQLLEELAAALWPVSLDLAGRRVFGG